MNRNKSVKKPVIKRAKDEDLQVMNPSTVSQILKSVPEEELGNGLGGKLSQTISKFADRIVEIEEKYTSIETEDDIIVNFGTVSIECKKAGKFEIDDIYVFEKSKTPKVKPCSVVIKRIDDVTRHVAKGGILNDCQLKELDLILTAGQIKIFNSYPLSSHNDVSNSSNDTQNGAASSPINNHDSNASPKREPNIKSREIIEADSKSSCKENLETSRCSSKNGDENNFKSSSPMKGNSRDISNISPLKNDNINNCPPRTKRDNFDSNNVLENGPKRGKLGLDSPSHDFSSSCIKLISPSPENEVVDDSHPKPIDIVSALNLGPKKIYPRLFESCKKSNSELEVKVKDPISNPRGKVKARKSSSKVKTFKSNSSNETNLKSRSVSNATEKSSDLKDSGYNSKDNYSANEKEERFSWQNLPASFLYDKECISVKERKSNCGSKSRKSFYLKCIK